MSEIVSRRFIYVTTFVILVLSIAGFVILRDHLWIFLITCAVSLFVFITDIVSIVGKGKMNLNNKQNLKNGTAFKMVILLLIIALIGFIGIEYLGSDRFYTIVLILAIAINSILSIIFVVQNNYLKVH